RKRKLDRRKIMSRLKEKLARLHRKTEAVSDETISGATLANNTEQKVEGNQALLHSTNKQEEHTISFQFADPYVEKLVQNDIGLFTNEFGSFLMKRIKYAVHFQHGMYQLKQLLQIV